MSGEEQSNPGRFTNRLIDLKPPFKDPLRRSLFGLLGGAAERLLSVDKINRIYYDIGRLEDRREFAEKCLDVMHVDLQVTEEDLARIPKTGRVVVVANHPFGGIEGVIMARLLQGVRPDFRIMANYLLGRIEGFNKLLILVDPFGRDDSPKLNMRPIKESLRWLKGDHALAVFPSGEVSHLNLKHGGIVDPPWSTMIARLVRMTEASVVPVYFKGNNGLLFQLAGMVHPRLRTALLAKEFANKRDKTIHVRIGHAIPYARLADLADDRALIDYARLHTYNLRNRPAAPRKERRLIFPIRFGSPEKVPVAAARDPAVIAANVAQLPPEQKLLTSGKLSAWYARAAQIPDLMHEIGRLREVTFRDAGEGTCREIDLDRFDDYYIHLFVWNDEKQELVGAYRLGQTDEILPRHGRHGLYTTTLFHYRSKLLESISPALEMGRSFIRKEYQRSFAPLLLLWKGIGHFVVKHPCYKILFGPVSVNADYTRKSQEILVRFLKDNNALPTLARLVKARRPLRLNPLSKLRGRRISHVVKNLDEVESLIADIETNIEGVPVLLRQYLKLGGKLLGFNIDPDFSNVLDGLILVDLTKTDHVILNRYMTPPGYATFAAYHKLPVPPPRAAATTAD